MLFGKYLENKLSNEEEIPDGKIQCEICGKIVKRNYYTRHKKTKYCKNMYNLMQKLRDVVVREFTGF
jgi:hypothetical protein